MIHSVRLSNIKDLPEPVKDNAFPFVLRGGEGSGLGQRGEEKLY